MLSGGASRAEGFTEMLAERFEAPVEPFDPVQEDRVRREEVPDRLRRRRRADRRGGGRPGAAAGGRPMIRINLLAVERGAAKKTAAPAASPAAQRVTIGAGADSRWSTVARHRLVVLVAAQHVDIRLDEDIAARRDRGAAAAIGAGAGPEVRDPQGAAAAARHADRAAAPRPDGPVHVLDEISKAHARSPLAGPTDAARRGLHASTADDVADGAVGLRRQSRDEPLVQEAGRDPRQPGRSDRRDGDMVRFAIKATSRRTRRRRRRRRRRDAARRRRASRAGRRSKVRSDASDTPIANRHGTLAQQTPVVRPDWRVRRRVRPGASSASGTSTSPRPQADLARGRPI